MKALRGGVGEIFKIDINNNKSHFSFCGELDSNNQSLVQQSFPLMIHGQEEARRLSGTTQINHTIFFLSPNSYSFLYIHPFLVVVMIII